MKLSRPIAALAGLALLAALGCQDNKANPPAAALNTITPEPTASVAPVAPTYDAPPVNTVSPADSAPVSLAADVAPSSSGGRYTIKRGDTLYRIAATHCGGGKNWQKIVDANPGVDPSHLRVGQTITLP